MFTEKLLELIQEKRPDLLKGLNLEEVTPEQVLELYNRAIKEAGEGNSTKEKDPTSQHGERASQSVGGGLGMLDKIGIAADYMFGIGREEQARLSRLQQLNGRLVFENVRASQDYDVLRGIPPLTGIRELYMLLTGDKDFRGQFDRRNLPASLRAAQDINSGTFNFILGNTLARRLVNDYLAQDFGESLLIS